MGLFFVWWLFDKPWLIRQPAQSAFERGLLLDVSSYITIGIAKHSVRELVNGPYTAFELFSFRFHVLVSLSSGISQWTLYSIRIVFIPFSCIGVFKFFQRIISKKINASCRGTKIIRILIPCVRAQNNRSINIQGFHFPP